jgi:hypothetical protein
MFAFIGVASGPLALASCTLLVSTSDLTGRAPPGADASTEAAQEQARSDALADVNVLDVRDGGVEGGVYFFDDFQRADGASIGNGWIEKNPAAFQLESGRVTKNVVTVGYRSNVVYRPANEQIRDVEAAIEFRLSTTSNLGYPQLWARAQTSTVGTVDMLDAYGLYFAGSTRDVRLVRNSGSNDATTFELGNVIASPPLNTTDTFRLRMRVTGTAPVHIDAYVEVRASFAWSTIAQLSVNDTNQNAITNAGVVAFSGHDTETAFTYDNFYYQGL